MASFNHCDIIGMKIYRIRWKNAKLGLLQRSGSFKVIEVGTNRKPVCYFLLVTDSNWHPISYRFKVIVQILDTLRFWAPLWRGLRDKVRCSSWAHWKPRTGLHISVNWTFFARCYGWCATSEQRSKIGDFAPTRSVWSIISGRRGRPPPPTIFARIVRPYNFVADSFHTRNFVGDFLQAIWNEVRFLTENGRFAFWAPLGGGLGATYDDHLRLIGSA